MAKKWNLKELENLSRLLLSEDENSLELGITLLTNAPQNTVAILNRELILVAYLHPSEEWRPRVYAWLLELYGEHKMKVWNEGFKIFRQLKFYSEYSVAVRTLIIQHENIRENFAALVARNRHYGLRYSDIGKLLHYTFKEHLDLAEKYYRIALETNPNHESTLFYLAHLLQVENRGTTEEIIAYYERVIAINPKESNASLNLGFLYRKMGNNLKAYQYYKQALSVQPHNSTYLRNVASACISLRGASYEQEAYQILKDLTQSSPNDPLVWNSWADYLWNIAQKYKEAEAAYQRGLVIDPNNPYLLGNLGELYIDEMNRIEEGLALYEKALEKKELNYRLTVMVTALVQHKKNWAAAKKYYQKLLANSMNNKVEKDYSLRDDQWQAFLEAEQKLKERLR